MSYVWKRETYSDKVNFLVMSKDLDSSAYNVMLFNSF